MKILLALSGGVDSAVAGLLLKRDGHEVVGCFMQSRYCAADDRRDALRVAAALDIPIVTLDVGDAYDADVIRPMLDGYASGITPNPDVDCNVLIKFPLLWQEAQRIGATAIATGHYAHISHHTPPYKGGSEGGYRLLRSTDPLKDQTYFLYRLTQDDLSHTLFPIGHLTKSEVRQIAREAGLPVADKRSTRGVCFVGPVKMREFVGTSVDREQGMVVATDGRPLGTHDGVQTYTVGQRAPVGGAEHPWYVISKQPETNTLVVAAEDDPARYQSEVTVTDVHWISGHEPSPLPSPTGRGYRERYPLPQGEGWGEGFSLTAKIRSRSSLIPLRIRGTEGVRSLRLSFDQPQPSLAPGQHIVLYDADVCLGGGVIVQ